MNKMNIYYMLYVCMCVCFSPSSCYQPKSFSITSKLHNLCTQGIHDVFEIGREHSSG